MAKKREKVSIFILNYNGIREFEGGSAASIKEAAEQLTDVDISVVFLDNFSNDGSAEVFKKLFPGAAAASTFRNEGYVRGTNIGLQLAWTLYHPDYFILVDSDNFTEPYTYRQLLAYARRRPEVAMIQPVVRSQSEPSRIISCGHTINKRGGTSSITDPNGRDDIENLESCSISSTLVRSDALLRTGLLNEKFVMYYESSDLSFRLRRSGYTCACCREAVSYNERLSGKRFQDFNKYYLMRRNLFLLWYIHDRERYFHYLNVWAEERNRLQSEADQERFITDYMKEAERRALAAAYHLQDHPAEEFIEIPGLDDFHKTDICIL